MKSFLGKILALILVCSVLSCSPKEEKTDDYDDRQAQFFKVVYLTQASRAIGSNSWIVVQGDFRLKFERSEGQDTTDSSSGNFTIHYTAYRETQLFNNGLCSGGYQGTFTLSETLATSTESSPTGPYNPLDPYNPGTTTSTSSTSTDEEDITRYVFLFALTVPTNNDISLSASCTPMHPGTAPATKSLRVIRFANGDLIVTDSVRGLEFYMIPEIVSTSTQ